MEKLSPLFCRHNGVMLGFFMFMSRFQFASEKYPFFRSRIQQFLDEIESGVEIPESHEDLQANFSSLDKSVIDVFVRRKNIALFQAFALGLGFCAKALDIPNQTSQALLEWVMEEYGLDPSLIDRYAAQVPRESDEISVDDVMPPALAFLREVIRPLDAEPDTCFVAMPFSEPFESYYPRVYQPLLEKNGFRALRAWGGVANEFHIHLMLELIDKSGCVLVELTGMNPNVIFEMGYALGGKKLVIQMGNVSNPISLANVQGLAVVPYDSSKEGWEEDAVNGLGNYIVQAILKLAGKADGDDDSV